MFGGISSNQRDCVGEKISGRETFSALNIGSLVMHWLMREKKNERDKNEDSGGGFFKPAEGFQKPPLLFFFSLSLLPAVEAGDGHEQDLEALTVSKDRPPIGRRKRKRQKKLGRVEKLRVVQKLSAAWEKNGVDRVVDREKIVVRPVVPH